MSGLDVKTVDDGDVPGRRSDDDEPDEEPQQPRQPHLVHGDVLSLDARALLTHFASHFHM